MTGFAVEKTDTIEVIAAWVAPKTVVPGVEATPGWFVIGQYPLPKSCEARLDVVHHVSAEGLTSRVRLWDATTGVPVNGAVETTSLAPARTLGGKVQLVGGRTYQVQAECVGAAGDDKFGVVETATITD